MFYTSQMLFLYAALWLGLSCTLYKQRGTAFDSRLHPLPHLLATTSADSSTNNSNATGTNAAATLRIHLQVQATAEREALAKYQTNG